MPREKGEEHMTDTFEKELEHLINKYCKENESNTPDWILANYLAECLKAFNVAVQQREGFYGRDPRPSEQGNKPT